MDGKIQTLNPINPRLLEGDITWRCECDPETKEVAVQGTYKHITYQGSAASNPEGTDAFQVIAHLKAGIMNLIVNALDEDAMNERVDWSGLEGVVEPDGSTTYRMFGDLDHNSDQRVDAAARNMPETLTMEQVEEGREHLKRLIWTEFYKKGWL